MISRECTKIIIVARVRIELQVNLSFYHFTPLNYKEVIVFFSVAEYMPLDTNLRT